MQANIVFPLGFCSKRQYSRWAPVQSLVVKAPAAVVPLTRWQRGVRVCSLKNAPNKTTWTMTIIDGGAAPLFQLVRTQFLCAPSEMPRSPLLLRC